MASLERISTKNSKERNIMVREIYENELSELLELYLYLHEETIPEISEHLENKEYSRKRELL